MDAAGFSFWLDNRLIPAFKKIFPGKKMILVMDNASYHKQQSTEYYPEGKGPNSATKGLNAHVLRRAGCTSIQVNRGGATPELFLVPPEEPEAYTTHREHGGPAPGAGDDGTVYARFPKGPSADELAAATNVFLKANCPAALESMVERKFANMEGGAWKVIWTPPYWPKCQPIELVILFAKFMFISKVDGALFYSGMGRGKTARRPSLHSRTQPRNNSAAPTTRVLRGLCPRRHDLGRYRHRRVLAYGRG
jgi:hypothetical protein